MEKKLVILLLGIVLLFSGNLLFAATAHDWLAAQQNSTTGLVDSFEGDNSTVAYTYDQACAVIAFTCENDLTRAKKILDKYAAMQNAEGSWDNGYFSDTGLATSTWRRSGETLWMILAMNYYTRKTGDTTYKASAKKAMDWILTLQETNPADPRYGSIYGGLTDVGARETWTSTEHNLDAYSALYYTGEIQNNQYYKDKAQLVYNYLVNKMWDNNAGRFYTGYNDYSTYLDPQSWSVVAIGKTGPAGQDFTRAITFAYNNMHITRSLNGVTYDGFDYDGTITAPGGGVWFEGTEQMAVTYEFLGNTTQANYYHAQAAKAQQANGGVWCAIGDGADFSWPTNFQHSAVATTSWFVFSSQTPRVNPFMPPVPSADTTPPVISGVAAGSITANSASITWTTNEASDSQVEYGLTASYGNSTTLNTSLVLSHSVSLTGLTANTLYHYRVKSKDAAGNLATGADNTFTTSSTTPPPGGSKNYAPATLVTTQGNGSGTYTALASDDNVFYSNNAQQIGSIFYTDWYAGTTIAEAKANVTKLTITWNGHYTSGQYQGLYLYNFVSAVWARLDYELVGTTEQTIVFSTTDIASYVSATGEIRVRTYTESASNVACYADYINFAIDTTGTADTTPPTISAVQSSGITATGATVTWTTDENSDSQVEYGLTTSYGSSSALNTSLVLSHSAALAGLTSNTLYHFRVKSKDAASNLATSGDYTFTTTGSGTLSKNYQPNGITVTQGTGQGSYTDLSADDNIFYSVNAMQNGSVFYTDWYAKANIIEAPANVTKLTITWNGHYTASQAQTLYLYNFVTSAWDSIDSSTVATTEMTITVVKTTNITSYFSSTGEIRLRTYTTRADNVCCYADYINFAIDYNNAPDTTPPTISAVASGSITNAAATITWTTNENSDSQVEYGTTTSYGSSSALNTSLVLSHSVSLSGLASGTLYHYRVKSKDAAGNLAIGGDYTFTTTGTQTKDYQATSVVVTRGSLGGNVGNLATNNSSYLTVTAAYSSGLYYNDWYTKTVIAETPANVAKLTITYDGKYSSSQSQGIYLYNFVTSVWARLDYRSVGTTDTTITFATTAIPSYVSSTGEIRVRIYTQSYSSHICSADYLKFSLEMKSGGSPALQNIVTSAAALNGGEVKLYDNLFNPAKGERTRVDYTIDDEGQVTIKIYNIVGELVRTLVDDNKAAGSYTEYWNGKNDSDETVASGVYLFFIEAPGIRTTKKAAVIK